MNDDKKTDGDLLQAERDRIHGILHKGLESCIGKKPNDEEKVKQIVFDAVFNNLTREREREPGRWSYTIDEVLTEDLERVAWAVANGEKVMSHLKTDDLDMEFDVVSLSALGKNVESEEWR